jgi:hypothetical protein
MNKHSSLYSAIVLVFALLSGCVPATLPSPATSRPIAETINSTPLTPVPTTTPIPPARTPIPKVLLPVRGLYVQFERRGLPSQYWSGEVINGFNKVDDVVGHTVSEEVALQLDQIKQMGVSTITFELRSSDATYIPGPFEPPACNLSPALGLQYPQPRPVEITNLVAFLDLLQSKGMKVYLRLVNTHMEEQPPAKNELWLGTILKAIKDHPALDLVLFEGNAHLIDTDGDRVPDNCGIPAEPPLWEGPASVSAVYVKWAIDYAHSLGVPWRKLSAQAIVGDYFTFMQTPNAFNTDGHFWDPIFVLKGIFDDLKVPDEERTYAISFYEHRKCSTAQGIPCVDANPHAWAIETATNLFATIGRDNGARVVAVEMGVMTPVEKDWTTEMALESLVWIMQAYGIDGGCFWRWTDFTSSEELDPGVQTPIKERGTEYIYTPVKDVLDELYVQGQANDLSLTPEQIAPVFSAVSVTPLEVHNGEPFVLTASLGETHLFVTADLSAVDPSQSVPILFGQVSDGVYQATVTPNRWNAAPNGIKTIQIKAMDFWSNVSSTTLEIDLENPAPVLDAVPPDDSFNGTTLDGSKWFPDPTGGAAVAQDEKLVLSTGEKEAQSSASVKSYWSFPGDFDVQVDFQIGEGWRSPAQEHVDGAYLAAFIDGQDYRITRLRSSGEDKLFSWSSTGALTRDWSTNALAGKYRLVRTGTNLTLLFDIGEGWKELASTSVPEGAALIILGSASVNASMAFTTYFDNFKINSGLTTYKP